MRQQPFVVATVTAYHGNSPEPPGACIFYSEQLTVNLQSAEHRFEPMLQSAKSALNNQHTFTFDKLPLGEVATTENGYCDVICEFWQASEYPSWLERLRENHQNNINTLLLREFSKKNDEVRTRVLSTQDEIAEYNLEHNPEQNIESFLQNNSKQCQLYNHQGGSALLRKVFNTKIQLTIVGSHPVATELAGSVDRLPVDLNQIPTKDCTAENLIKIASDSYVVIMTGDHTIDYQCCQNLLSRRDLTYIACMGSDRKAELFRQKLNADGTTAVQLSQLRMPAGLKEINGKQPAVVATSILAEVLSLYDW